MLNIGPFELDADGFVIIDQEVFDEDTGHMLTARDAGDGYRYPLDEWVPIQINVAGCPSLGIPTMRGAALPPGRELEA